MSNVCESADSVELSRATLEPVRLAALFAVLYFIQGVGEPVAGLVAQPVRSLLKTWGEGPSFIAAFSAAVSLPWTLKPLYGMLSDFVPFAGYRRKSYLILASLVSLLGFAFLYQYQPSKGSYFWFLALLLAPTVAIAFSDVLVDALMVEKGQPLGLTGVLQSVQWTASYAATLMTGIVGGYLSQTEMEYEAFLLCAILALVTLFMSWRFVDEEAYSRRDSFKDTWEALKEAGSSPVLLSVSAFLFLWSLDPLSTTVVYIHITETLGWSEQFFGYTLSLLALGCILGSIGYAFYCRRVPMRLLTHLAIVLGALSQAAYCTMDTRSAAVVVHILVGATWMTATLIQLDLAARVCPPKAAATVFAVLMALTNLASSLGEWIGGFGYDKLLQGIGNQTAFAIMVGIGTAIKACCWLLMLLPARWSEGPTNGDDGRRTAESHRS